MLIRDAELFHDNLSMPFSLHPNAALTLNFRFITLLPQPANSIHRMLPV